MAHGRYHPITQCKMTGAFDANNNLVALHYRLSGQSILFSLRPEALQNGMNFRQLIGRIGLWLSVFVIVSPAILFFLWMLSLSLKFEVDNAAYPPVFFPDRIAWKNYADVLASNRFLTYFINSLIVTGSATLLALIVGVPAGYGIARMSRKPISNWPPPKRRGWTRSWRTAALRRRRSSD